MAIKSSSVTARVEPEIKEEAEAIIAQLGISASNGINTMWAGIRPGRWLVGRWGAVAAALLACSGRALKPAADGVDRTGRAECIMT